MHLPCTLYKTYSVEFSIVKHVIYHMRVPLRAARLGCLTSQLSPSTKTRAEHVLLPESPPIKEGTNADNPPQIASSDAKLPASTSSWSGNRACEMLLRHLATPGIRPACVGSLTLNFC